MAPPTGMYKEMLTIVRGGLPKMRVLAILLGVSSRFGAGHSQCFYWLPPKMHDLHIKRQQVYGIELIELTGAVDALAFVQFSVTLTKMIEEVNPCVILECSRVTYVGSAQLKQLINLAHVAQARGGDLKCVGLPRTIQHVANLIAMGDLMEFHNDVQQALQAFRGLPAGLAQ